jgi:HD-GYP domain-containing protein (c-di-GMP phosphodiesterase class II)
MQTSVATDPRFDEQLLALSSKIDEFEGYKHAHGLRIGEIADAIGQRFGMSVHDRYFMQHASLLHDIGELVMNRSYIRESRTLSEIERLDMVRHSVIGEQEAAKRGLSRGVQLLIRWHHEWWNGNGYPDRLQGERVPLGARIIRVADSFAALTDDRPRRAARTNSEARQFISEYAGIEFDPKVVKIFLEISADLVSELPAIDQVAGYDQG